MKTFTLSLLALMAGLTLQAQPGFDSLATAKDVAAEATEATHEAEKAVEEGMEVAAEELELSEAIEETPAVETAAPQAEAKVETPVPAATDTTKTAAEKAAPAPKPAAQPTPSQDAAAATAAAGMVNGQRMVDEVDLEEDDAALAARRPKVKSADGSEAEALVDIDCDEATLADILRQFRKTTGRNIISGESTNLLRRVSVTLRNVPWHKALTAILNSRGFRLDKSEDIYRVVEDTQTIKFNTRSFCLKHASALELCDLFNNTYSIKDKNGKIIRQIATCFESANVVVVTADDKTLSACNEIIEAVDKAVAQIYIEARFLELSTEALHKLGLNWSALESWHLSAKNVSFGWENNFGRLNNFSSKEAYTKKNMVKTGTSTSDSSSSSSNDSSSDQSSSSKTISDTTPQSSSSLSKSLQSNLSKSLSQNSSDSYTDLADGAKAIGKSLIAPGSILKADGAGLSENSMAWNQASGFSGQLSASDFSLALSAFESLGEGKTFSNPRIIVSNGKEAKVDMTTKEPNVTISSSYTGTSSQNLSISTSLETIPGEDKQMFAKEAFFSYGIELRVRPRISPDGLISVEIIPTISEKKGDKEIAGSSTSAPYTTYPIISVKRLTTEFTMKDGSTAVIGGLTQTSEQDIDSGIPYLRKIPWIGPKLFGWKSREKVQTEIIICVTVGIANPADLPREIGLPTNAVMGREYIRGERQEPGQREGTAAKILSLDMRPIEEQQEDVKKKVKIAVPTDEVQSTSPSGSVRISITH